MPAAPLALRHPPGKAVGGVALRSMELFATEVRPRIERALGPLDRIGVA